MSSETNDKNESVARRYPRVLTGLLLAGFVLGVDGWGIQSGLFLDDHAHYQQLKAGDWSFRSAVDSARLGIVGDVMDLWSRYESGLRFFRPISFWLMRIEYTLNGWDPGWMHGFSLLWHWLASMLVASLAYLCIGRRFWAGVAGCLFATHPGQVATVYWIACQTEIFVVLFMLGATLSYSRYSLWPRPMFGRRAGAMVGDAPSGSLGWLVGALVLFGLAMGCRENAVVWPGIMAAGDLLTGRMRQRSRWVGYAVMGGLFMAYMVLRQSALGGFQMPAKPYIMLPSDPGFARFIFDKVTYYLLGLFAYLPVVPIAGMAYLRERPDVFYTPLVILLATWVPVGFAFRRQKGILFCLAWVFLSMGPVLPVFASSHHLYFPMVGAMLFLTGGLAMLSGVFSEGVEAVPRKRRIAVGTILALHLAGFSFGSWAFGWVFTIGTSIEDMLVEDVQKFGGELAPGDDLYFVNMPMLAYYAVPALEEATGVRPLYGHVLTFSSGLVNPDESARLSALDDRRLRVASGSGVYFAGTAGKTLLEMMKLPVPLPEGEVVSGELFEAHVEQADESGVRQLTFDFAEPMDRATNHFFITTSQRYAYPIDLRRIRTRVADHQHAKVVPESQAN